MKHSHLGLVHYRAALLSTVWSVTATAMAVCKWESRFRIVFNIVQNSAASFSIICVCRSFGVTRFWKLEPLTMVLCCTTFCWQLTDSWMKYLRGKSLPDQWSKNHGKDLVDVVDHILAAGCRWFRVRVMSMSDCRWRGVRYFFGARDHVAAGESGSRFPNSVRRSLFFVCEENITGSDRLYNVLSVSRV